MRRRRKRERDPGDPRQKALDLIALALDRSTTEDERRNAAVHAVDYIDRHDLLSERKRHDTVQAAVNAVDTLTDVVDTIKGSGVLDDLKTIVERGGAAIGQARRRR